MDFEKELQKFDFFEIDEGFINMQNETSVIFDAFNSVLRRLGVDQNRTNMQVEEILSLLDEQKEKGEDLAEIKRRLESSEEEKLSLVKGFIAVLDHIEDLYRYAAGNDDGGWSRQLEIIWNAVSKELLSAGIVRIEGENTIYNQKLNSVREIRNNPDVPDGMILEVIRSGYIYKSTVLRKAEVVVNKNLGGGDENDGQNSGDRPWDVNV